MAVTIVGNNTPTAGGVVYGDGTNYASTAAGTSGQPIVSGGAGAPTFRPYTLPAADGSPNQVLQTNGAGALSFATPAAGGLTLVATLTPANLATTTAITGIASYKSIMAITDGITISVAGGLMIAVSSDNGSSYSTANTFTNTNGTGPQGFAQLFRSDASPSNKPIYFVNVGGAGASNVTNVTGIINAVRISINNAATFTGTGNIYIYGMN